MRKIFKAAIPLVLLVIIIGMYLMLNADNRLLLYNCQSITRPGSYLLAQDINPNISICFDIKSDNVILNGGGHVLKGPKMINTAGINADSVKNVVIENFEISNYANGIYLSNSQYVNVLNNSLLENLQGIYLSYIYNSNISDNQIERSQNIGLIIENSNSNSVSGNIIKFGLNPIFIGSSFDNNIVRNLYDDNIQLTLQLNRTASIVSQNAPVNFEVALGQAADCFDCSYKIELTPKENNFSYERDGDQIKGMFVPTSKGIYSLWVSFVDSSKNTEQSKFIYLVGPTENSEEDYYFRGINPSHGQTRSLGIYGQDSGTLIHENPSGNEIRICSDDVAFYPDKLPKYLFGVVKGINFSITYSDFNDTTLGVERFATYDSFQYSKNMSFPSTNGSLVSRSLSFRVNWTMNYYWEWYWQAIKMSSKEGNPQVDIRPKDTNIASFYYAYPSTPAIRDISSENAIILAATMNDSLPDRASIIFKGQGNFNTTIEMPNHNKRYNSIYNGNNCGDANCKISRQQSGILDFSLNANGLNDLEIIPA